MMTGGMSVMLVYALISFILHRTHQWKHRQMLKAGKIVSGLAIDRSGMGGGGGRGEGAGVEKKNGLHAMHVQARLATRQKLRRRSSN